MTQVYDVEERAVVVRVKVGDTVKEFDRAITVEDVKAFAKENGVKKFTISPAVTFPYNGSEEIVVTPYFEAK